MDLGSTNWKSGWTEILKPELNQSYIHTSSIVCWISYCYVNTPISMWDKIPAPLISSLKPQICIFTMFLVVFVVKYYNPVTFIVILIMRFNQQVQSFCFININTLCCNFMFCAWARGWLAMTTEIYQNWTKYKSVLKSVVSKLRW